MRVLVAGATGILGGPLLRALTGAGHEVIGIARTQKGADLVRDRGGQPVIADVLDLDGLLRALEGTRADAVAHELTALKKAPTRYSGMRETNRLRIGGSACWRPRNRSARPVS